MGKSTLLNTLTDAGVLAKDMLFATLDPTSRALTLPDGRKVMLIDTVGLGQQASTSAGTGVPFHSGRSGGC